MTDGRAWSAARRRAVGRLPGRRVDDPSSTAGLLLLDERGRVEVALEGAARLLDGLADRPGLLRWLRDAADGTSAWPAAGGGWIEARLQRPLALLVPLTPGSPRHVEVELDRVGATLRERQVGLLALRGLDAASIARALGGRAATVRVHLKHLYAKLGVSGQTELQARLLLGVSPPR